MSNLSELLPSGGGQNLVEFVASGTLPNGKPVILNSDGTVTVVGLVPTDITETIPDGSESTFNTTGRSLDATVAFDPITENRFLMTYGDSSNSYYGTAIVGTISGTTLTFGAKTVYSSAMARTNWIEFDPNNSGKVLISYLGTGADGKVQIGTISGTSITFGTAVSVNSGSATETAISLNTNVANQFVVAYKDNADTKVMVGTISGTSITLGTAVALWSGASTNVDVDFDPYDATRFIVGGRDPTSPFYGKVRIGTISGTSITLGTASTFYSGSTVDVQVKFIPTVQYKFVVTWQRNSSPYNVLSSVGTISGSSISYGTSVAIDSGTCSKHVMYFCPSYTGKFLVFYIDGGNEEYGKLLVGTVSGTSISYGSEVVVNASNAIDSVGAGFDTHNNGRFMAVYGMASVGNVRVGIMGGTAGVTNLTATNLIGITSEATSSGGTAKINTWGGINEAQTSLTIASDYYAQTDGTITTSDAGQKLGTAISATTINIKDLT